MVSLAFGAHYRDAGITRSVGGVSDGYDNAPTESFRTTLECELIGRSHWHSYAEARIAAAPPKRLSRLPSTARLSTSGIRTAPPP